MARERKTHTAAFKAEAALAAVSQPGSVVGLMLSSERNKGAILGRFAPRANPEYACTDMAQAIGTLITTDTMSEGLNLQDCDTIINYDLHWNPVRLIQRFGRVDRIGSEFDRVSAFNFLPEAGLERTLGLREILRCRIREIHETIGEDSSILEADERLNEQAMYAIYEATNLPLETLDDEKGDQAMYLTEAEEMFRLLREKEPEEYARIAALPDGLRSARWSTAEGVFLFSEAGSYRELVLIDRRGQVVSRDIPRLLGILRCPRDTPTAAFPDHLAGVLLRGYRQFAQDSRERQTGRAHLPDLSQGQRYVLKQLRALFSSNATTDVRTRSEQLEKVFRLTMPQAVIRELNRLRKDGLTGESLLRSLARIYHAYGLQYRTRVQDLDGADGFPHILCGEAFVQAPPSAAREERPPDALPSS